MNTSDIIEAFLMESFGEDNSLNVSRNELAQFFGCAPSQINYVLNTRFTLNRGFSILSQRGGGGFIQIVRVLPTENDYLMGLLNNNIGASISNLEGQQILKNLRDNKYLTEDAFNNLSVAINQKSLLNPFKMEDMLRANILKNVIINLIDKKSVKK